MVILQKIKHWLLLRKMRVVMRYEQRNKIMGTKKEYDVRNRMIDKSIKDFGEIEDEG